jgi:hypothetical protein
MTLTFSAWGPFWSWVMSNSTLLPFLQVAVATTGDRAEVHEHVRATVHRDEAVTLVTVEPLHRALRHLDLLRPGHSTPPRRRENAPAAIALASLSRNPRM